eukprot:PhF_6_TR33366/c0_g1_i1/m.48767
MLTRLSKENVVLIQCKHLPNTVLNGSDIAEEMAKMKETSEMSMRLKKLVATKARLAHVAFHRVIIVYGTKPKKPPSTDPSEEGNCHYLYIPPPTIAVGHCDGWITVTDWASIPMPSAQCPPP